MDLAGTPLQTSSNLSKLSNSLTAQRLPELFWELLLCIPKLSLFGGHQQPSAK